MNLSLETKLQRLLWIIFHDALTADLEITNRKIQNHTKKLNDTLFSETPVLEPISWSPEISRTKVGGEGPLTSFKIGEWFSYQVDLDIPPVNSSSLLFGVTSFNPYNDGKHGSLFFEKLLVSPIKRTRIS